MRRSSTWWDLVRAGTASGEPVVPGLARPLPAIAAVGTDEFQGVFLLGVPARGVAPAVARQVGVRATDTAREWMLTPVAQGNPLEAEGGRAVVEGPVRPTSTGASGSACREPLRRSTKSRS